MTALDELREEIMVVDPLDKEITLEVDMASQREINFKLTRGARKLIVFQLEDEEDISSARTIKFTLKYSFAEADSRIVLQKDHDPIRSNLAKGKIVFEFSPADTRAFDPDTFWYDVWVDLTNQQAYQVAIGCLTLERSIWRRTP